MALDVDQLLDRRRLKRQLTVWRVATVVALVAAVAVAAETLGGLGRGDHVARLEIEGVIAPDTQRDEALRSLTDDGSARAVIVAINSPGGTVVGGQGLYAQLRALAEKKPVVAVMGDVATSAAYMAVLGCDRLIGREGSLTGSIGVILQTADVTGLLNHLGIKPETIKSGPLKAQPNPLEPLSPEAREATRRVVFDVYDSFVALVQDRRRLSREQVLPLADGRVFTGRQAVANGLIDALGGEADAMAWLQEAHGISKDLPVRTVKIGDESAEVVQWLHGMVGKFFFSERLSLDGLVSLWQPGD
jgi:protease-4